MTKAPAQDLVVDASVALKWQVPEPFTAEARRFLGNQFRLHAPSFFAAECANVFLKKSLQRAELTFDEAGEHLRDLLTVSIQFHATERLAPAALDLALEVGRAKLAIYDYFYLALAIQLDCG